jgi:hypothetical protein
MDDWSGLAKPMQLGLFTLALLSPSLCLVMTYGQLEDEQRLFAEEGNSYEAALALTRDIPDGEPVAAYDVSAWPIVATGQRVVSVPWPEPMIDGLAARQAAAERLFDPALTRDQRLALARIWGAKILIMDKKGPLRRKMPKGMLQTLEAQSVRHSQAGQFIRFDLE